MTTGTAADGGSIQLDSLPIVDLRLLSQSELYSLSLCSSTAFDPRRCVDVVIPKIDRSVFNESAGSRKQTYSRLRLAPPSSSSSSAAPRRRTPHLRSAPPTIFANVPDPENADNSHIVSLLKKLFVAELNPEELVPVNIDYSDSLPAQQFQLPTLPPPSQSSVQVTGHKRKRGRPRRDEVLGNEGGLAAPEVSVGDVSGDAGVVSSLNEVLVHESMEDKDREILNKDVVAVDLVALGKVEHPYIEELSRRTEGLKTEEEFLGYMEGLSGEWGSRRKKKRVVDANEFGAALPVGWKLSLAIKKKNDQVWLYCRRYISPSGLHFVSCKGVSSYLLSLHGIQDTNLPNSSQPYEMVNDVDKLTCITIPDLAVKADHTKENLLSNTPSSPIDSKSGNHETQTEKNTADFPKYEGREIWCCDKCNITFSSKDECLHHQSSHQRKRLKNGTRITDGVIIKDGKYECQFCHKTFGERHRYNGHVGAHVRYQGKVAGESGAGNLGDAVGPPSFSAFHFKDTVMQELNSDNGRIVYSLGNKGNENVGDLKEAIENMSNDVPTDVINKTDQCEVLDVSLSNNSRKPFYEDEKAKDGAAEKIVDDSSFEGKSGDCSPLPVDAAAIHDHKNVSANENSSGTWKPDQCVVPKSSGRDSNQHVEECEIVLNNVSLSEARNESKLDSENLAINGSVFDFFGIHGGSTSTSESLVCKLEVPNVNMLEGAQYEVCGEENVPYLINNCKGDEKCMFEISEKDSYQAADDAVSKHEEIHLGISSAIPSWNEQEKVPMQYNAVAITHPLKEPVVPNSFKTRLVALSGQESMRDLEGNDDKVCGSKNKASEFNHYQTSGNGESTDPFSSSHVELNSNTIMGTLKDTQLGVCTGLSSATDKQFFQEDNMMGIFDGALEEHRQEGQLRGASLSQSGKDPGDHFKLNALENSGKHELSLSFGNYQTELCMDFSKAEHKRYHTDSHIQSVDSFHSISVGPKTSGDRTNFGMRNSNVPGDLNQGRPFHVDVPDSTFNMKTHKFGSNFSGGHTGDQIGASGQSFMVSFGNSGSQPGDCGTTDGSWRTGHENVFQGTFDATARLHIPRSDCFGTFDLTSDKVEEGSFGFNKNYNIHSNVLRPGRTEPVEYRFLGEESSNSMPEESKIFSYTANMDRLDPSFWLGKDDIMTYTSNTNQVSSICVWCRNMFFHQPGEFGTQTGAIGSICPSCTSKIPG